MTVYQDKRTGNWCYRFKRNNILYHRCFKDATRDEVVQFEIVAKSELIKSKYDIASENKVYALREIMDDYENYIRNAYSREDNIESAIRVINRLFNLIGNKQTSLITVSDIERYRTSRKNVVKNSSINREIDYIKKMFSLALDNRKIKENPCYKLEDLRETNPTKRYLTKEEEKKLLSVANPLMQDIIIFALHTGMRSSEIKNLKWSDVFLREKYLIALNTKNGKSRELLITPQMHQILKRLPRISEFVFVNQQTGQPYKEFKRTFKRTVERAGIEPITFHELRHSTASRLNELGVDLETIKEYLGHSDSRTTQKYIHKPKDSILNAVKKLSKY